ncbi:uncharacterized protein LOC141906646 isoform X3 [Tubulanus polymorphus]|uniref:uncharacterized protein LOC141906646 isoform X3 n=1 Tax=Tubulanus polymorphus TaxID=672921 RepID=UPI003DA572B1
MGNCKSKDASTDALEDRIAAKASKALANEAKKQLQNQSEITNHQSEESEAMVKDANHINNEPDVIKHTLDDVMAAPPPDEKPLLDEVVTGDLLKEIDFETSGVHTSPASIEDVEISETIIQTTDINQNDTDAQQQQLTNGNISSEQAATGSVNGELLVDTAAAQPAAAPIDAPVKPTDKDVTADLLSLDNSKEPDKSVSESNTADLLGLSANVDKGEPPSPVPSTVAGAPVDQKPAASVKSEATAPVTASTEHGLDAFDPLATPKPSQTDETKTASSSNKTIPSKKVDSPKKSGLPKPKQVQSSPKRSVSTEPTKTRPLSASTDAAAAKKSPAKTRPVSASVEGAVKATPHKPHSPKMTPTPRPTTAPTVSRSHSRSEADKVQSKCGSKDNIKHTPGGGNVKIESKKLDFKGKAKSRIGSLDNATHTPKGGEKKIESKKLEWKVESRVGSLQNATHKPKGGDKKIENRKLNWDAKSKVGSLANAEHTPGGGKKKIENRKLDWKVESKVGSLDNATHKAGGGERKIETKKLDFKEKAQSKVGSKDNMTHKPGGGDKKIETVKLTFKEDAKPKTDAGAPKTVSESSKSPRESKSGSISGTEGEVDASN